MSPRAAHAARKAHRREPGGSPAVPPAPAATEEMAKQLRQTLSQMDPPRVAAAPPKSMRASDMVVHAMKELAHISGLEADHVSSVECEPDGWHVTVDLIELRRIPASTDVIAAYDAVFAPDGSLLSYHRRRRYFRDQMTEEK
jgi:hypothetical protein